MNVKLKFLFRRNFVNVSRFSSFEIAQSSFMRNTKVYVASGAKLIIGSHVNISNCVICVEKGECIIHDNCIIGSPAKGGQRLLI